MSSFNSPRYVVIGNPIAQSKSPTIHRLFAAQNQLQLDYQTCLFEPDAFEVGVRQLIEAGVKGANVTMPFKLDAFALANQLSVRAKAAGAVNTLTFKDGIIYGDNTDGAGLVNDIVQNAGFSLNKKRVLILGAGGAARGVILPLLKANIAQLCIANRTLTKAQDLASMARQYWLDIEELSKQEKIHIDAMNWDMLNASTEHQFDIVINATAASMNDDVPPISSYIFAKPCLAYDMTYRDELTSFLGFAKEHQAHVRDGLGMLIEQAAESFFVWHGVRPLTKPVMQFFRPESE